MKHLLSPVAIILLLFATGCTSHRLGPIAREYYDAGGGDPTDLTGDQVMAWFLDNRRDFATHVADDCRYFFLQGSFLQKPEHSVDLKVCLAAKWAQKETLPYDGRKF